MQSLPTQSAERPAEPARPFSDTAPDPFTAHAVIDELGVATEPKGLVPPSIWFGGGRVGAHVEHEGTIEEIIYYGAQPINRPLFFKVSKHSPYQKVFCPYLLIDDRAYLLDWESTRVFPAGYVSHLALPQEGVEIAHSLILLNDAIMYRIEVRRNDRQRALRLRLALHESARIPKDHRNWHDWREDVVEGVPVITVSDRLQPAKQQYDNPGVVDDSAVGTQGTREQADADQWATTWIGVVGDTAISTRCFHSGRRYFETKEISGQAAAVSILFGHNETDFKARVGVLRHDGARLGVEQVTAWEKQLRDAPQVMLHRPEVESFFRQAGLITSMLRPTDLPGAMRASVGHYWVWGWDTMVYCDSELVSGSTEFIRQALDLYRRTAHPVHGVGHQFSQKMEVLIPQALSAQGLYLNMLYQYVTFTDDHAGLAEFYPFARTVFERTISQGRTVDLFRGSALWPDFPKFAGHRNREGEVSDLDISIFNNSIFYQSARAMEHLAGLMKDEATARSAREVWQPLETAFRDRFWDPAREYWIDSIDAETLEPRRHYPAHAILWVNPFARELVAGREEACAQFLCREHVCAGGVRPYPPWDAAFNGDGNQMGQWYPTGPDLFLLKTAGATGRQEILRRWLDWVAEFWSQYTVPEGLTLEAENDGPHRPDCPGGKQPFTVKPWHVAIITAILGVELDHGGITVSAGLDEPVTLLRLPFLGRQLAVSTAGAGTYVQSIVVDGKPVAGSCKIPADAFSERQPQIQITRTTERPQSPQILSADGAALSDLTATDSMVRCQLDCPGSVRIWLQAPAQPTVTWEGANVEATYDPQTGRASILLIPKATMLTGKLVITL